MSYLIDTCFICLKYSNNLVRIDQDEDGTSIEEKLKCFLPELELNSNIPKYICGKCANNLNESYEFKQLCLRNIITYERYAQQIITTDISKSQNEIMADMEDSKEIIIKEEPIELVLNDESLLQEIKQENDENEIGENVETPNDCVLFPTENKNLDEAKLESNIRSHNTKQHKCRNCNKIFSNLQDMIQHVLEYYKKKLYKCNICNKSFRQYAALRRHKRIHNAEVCNESFIHSLTKKNICEVCNKSFSCSSNLTKHKLIHTSEKPFTCEICNKLFRQSSALKRHKLIHTGEKPYFCKVCNKSFRQSTTLNQHSRIHTGEKPFVCEVCNKSFTHLATLHQHKYVHTEERQFACEICSRSFRRSSNMYRHKRTHIAGK